MYIKKRPKELWLFVSKDEYELPIIVADSCRELAQMLGISPGTIQSSISRSRRLGVATRYRKVRWITDQEEEEIFEGVTV